MKKIFATIICLILIAASIATFCACDAILNSAWESVGLDKSTIKLPDLKMNSVLSVKSKDEISLTIIWNGGTKDAFDSLVEQCYVNIPANLNDSDEEISSSAEAVDEYDEMVTFNAKYQKSGKPYLCSIVLFKTDVAIEGVHYKSGQLVLILQAQIVQVGNINSWDIKSDDKTWFTEEELAMMGFDGLKAPNGVILGKLVENFDDSVYFRMSIEVSEINTYDEFIKLLFEEYSMNLTMSGEIADNYHNDDVYRATSADRVWFGAQLNDGEHQGTGQITWEYGHIVINLMVEKQI